MIRNKTIKFNMDNEQDRDLWNFLSALPHGVFSETVKEFWKEKLDQAYQQLNADFAKGKYSVVYGHAEVSSEKMRQEDAKK